MTYERIYTKKYSKFAEAVWLCAKTVIVSLILATEITERLDLCSIVKYHVAVIVHKMCRYVNITAVVLNQGENFPGENFGISGKCLGLEKKKSLRNVALLWSFVVLMRNVCKKKHLIWVYLCTVQM